MSKKNKNAVETTAMPETSEKQKKNGGIRFLAFLLLAVCAVAFAVIPFGVLGGAESGSLLTIVTSVFSSGFSALGFLPALEVNGVVGVTYALSVYVFAVGVVVAAILFLFAVFSAKKSPCLVRSALAFLFSGAFFYTMAYMIAANALNVEAMEMMSLAIAAVALLLYFFLAIAKAGKIAWFHLLTFACCAAYAFFLSKTISADASATATEVALGDMNVLILLAASVLMLINCIVAACRMQKKDGKWCDLVRYSIAVLVALAVIYVEHNSEEGAKVLFPIVAAIIATVEILFIVAWIRKANKKEVEVAVEEATEQIIQGFHTEEYAEAYAYEGGPVAGVIMAEEVNPSFLPHEPHVSTAGYDFYNCKSFDPFIATLTEQERNQFTELFIMRFGAAMPEIPEYVVGGNNNEFFRKVFIYLGQYRDRIPSALLSKMYQFSIKI